MTENEDIQHAMRLVEVPRTFATSSNPQAVDTTPSIPISVQTSPTGTYRTTRRDEGSASAAVNEFPPGMAGRCGSSGPISMSRENPAREKETMYVQT